MTEDNMASSAPAVGINAKSRTESEGESTENWAIQTPGFLGGVRQILDCARCGGHPWKRNDEPRHYRDIGKRTLHVLCDECWDALP